MSIDGEGEAYWSSEKRTAAVVFPEVALNSFDFIAAGESARSTAFTWTI